MNRTEQLAQAEKKLLVWSDAVSVMEGIAAKGREILGRSTVVTKELEKAHGAAVGTLREITEGKNTADKGTAEENVKSAEERLVEQREQQKSIVERQEEYEKDVARRRAEVEECRGKIREELVKIGEAGEVAESGAEKSGGELPVLVLSPVLGNKPEPEVKTGAGGSAGDVAGKTPGEQGVGDAEEAGRKKPEKVKGTSEEIVKESHKRMSAMESERIEDGMQLAVFAAKIRRIMEEGGSSEISDEQVGERDGLIADFLVKMEEQNERVQKMEEEREEIERNNVNHATDLTFTVATERVGHYRRFIDEQEGLIAQVIQDTGYEAVSVEERQEENEKEEGEKNAKKPAPRGGMELYILGEEKGYTIPYETQDGVRVIVTKGRLSNEEQGDVIVVQYGKEKIEQVLNFMPHMLRFGQLEKGKKYWVMGLNDGELVYGKHKKRGGSLVERAAKEGLAMPPVDRDAISASMRETQAMRGVVHEDVEQEAEAATMRLPGMTPGGIEIAEANAGEISREGVVLVMASNNGLQTNPTPEEVKSEDGFLQIGQLEAGELYEVIGNDTDGGFIFERVKRQNEETRGEEHESATEEYHRVYNVGGKGVGIPKKREDGAEVRYGDHGKDDGREGVVTISTKVKTNVVLVQEKPDGYLTIDELETSKAYFPRAVAPGGVLLYREM